MKSTQHGEYITAALTVDGWEGLLNTEFHEFKGPRSTVRRAFKYAIPSELESHVHAVLNVLEVRYVL